MTDKLVSAQFLQDNAARFAKDKATLTFIDTRGEEITGVERVGSNDIQWAEEGGTAEQTNQKVQIID